MNRTHALRGAGVAVVLVVSGMLAVPLLALGVASRPPTPLGGVAGEIPPRVLRAYQAAASACAGLRWELLAGIGWVESRHGSEGGAVVDEDSGEAVPWIFGPPLDGASGTQAIPVGRWAGWWAMAGPWERAVGPMQFRAPTFTAWAVDADGNGAANPHDVDDASSTAAAFLCAGTGKIADERAALMRYNSSEAYVAEVLDYAERLGAGGLVAGPWACPVAGPTSFIDTWGAPRSGGRLHKGVDMFAAEGTPVVAPVAGAVEHSNDSLGGLSFRLWGEDGNYYFGTHLSAFGRSGPVIAGTIVGYVGSTGNARGTGAHLHFEIHPGRHRGGPSRPVNPTPTVAAHCVANRIGVGLTSDD